jgi:hypothetical protein
MLPLTVGYRPPQQGAAQRLKGRQRKGSPILFLVAQVLGAGLIQLLPASDHLACVTDPQIPSHLSQSTRKRCGLL